MTRSERHSLWVGLAFISPWVLGFLARPMRAARIPSGLRAIEQSLRTETASARPH